MPEVLLRRSEEEDEEAKRKRFRPSYEQIDRMMKLLRLRHEDFLRTLDFNAQRAIAAASVAYGYERGAKLVQKLQSSTAVESKREEGPRTDAAMEKCREIGHEVKSTEIREVSQFAWSYYNDALREEQVTHAQVQLIRNESEVKGSEEEKERPGEGPHPMAIRIAKRQKDEMKEGERERAHLAVLQKVALKEEKKISEEAVKIDLDEMRKVMASAAADNSVSQMLEYAVRKKEGEGEMRLLEVDQKKVEALGKEIGLNMERVAAQIAILNSRGKRGEKEKKLRVLRKKLAFWSKARGALRRLEGGFFGAIRKLLG